MTERRNLPIGLFDSGVGGLSVLRALRIKLPAEDYMYLGDTARLPYGTKSSETIIRYALQASRKLVDSGIKLLVVACNTVSSVALPALTRAYPDLPVIGVVEPGAMAACKASKSGHIVVIATSSTTRDGAYVRAINALRPEAKVTGLGTQLLVTMAEEGWFEGRLVEDILGSYLDPFFKHAPEGPEAPVRADCLVLGCTHFPLLLKSFRPVVGEAVTVVDSAETTANTVDETLAAQALYADRAEGRVSFMTTDDVLRFAATGSLFLGTPINPTDVMLVDL